MFVELHILQNFAPSNLNRDDTGAPKDCDFGGYRRARISSQCIKRAIREQFRQGKLFNESELALRTKRVGGALADRMAQGGKDREQARSVAETAIRSLGIGLDGEKTDVLLFLSNAEIDRVADLLAAHWDVLVQAASTKPEEPADTSTRAGRRRRQTAERPALPNDVKKALLGALDGFGAADLALFGRMIAKLQDKKIEAAAQVAHAISTNKVSMEFDFYTAVDDLRPEDTAGADMMGTVEFNSACFYRYGNVCVEDLKRNLNGDPGLAEKTIEAFLRAAIAAVPTGKQNSMAAHNPPSFVFAVVRDSAPWNLANAFVRPVAPTPGHDLVQRSIAELARYWGELIAMYDSDGVVEACAVALGEQPPVHLGRTEHNRLDELISRVMGAVRTGLDGTGAS